MIFIYILVSIILLWIFAPLILGIPITYLTIKQNIKHNIEEYNEDELPAGCKDYFSNQYSELIPLGFSHKSYFKHTNTGIPNHIIYTAIIDNPKIETVAILYNCINLNIQLNYMEFSCKFTDDYTITTHNANIFSIFIYPEHIIMNKIETDNIKELLENHLTTIEELKENRIFKDRSKLDYIYEFEKAQNEIFQYQIENGLMKSCENGMVYRPTFIGAIRMVFQQWILFKHIKIK